MKQQEVVAHGAEMGIDFERLFLAMSKKQVLMIEGGFCHYHLRRDRQLTIHVILSNKKGAGYRMLEQLKKQPADMLLARCPVDLESNKWYRAQGFVLKGTQFSKTGREINIWEYKL